MENKISYCLDLYHNFDYYNANRDKVFNIVCKLYLDKRKPIDYDAVAAIFKTKQEDIYKLIIYHCVSICINIPIRRLSKMFSLPEQTLKYMMRIRNKKEIVSGDSNKINITPINSEDYKKNIKPQHYIVYIYDDTITIDKSCIFDYNRKEFSRCGNLYCKSYEVSYKCGNCKCVSYCSRECQKADWKTHKLVCNQLSNKFTTKSDRKNLLYHNILMKNFLILINHYELMDNWRHWRFYLDNDDKFTFVSIPELSQLKLEKLESYIILYDQISNIIFLY
tara:strand:- start:67 stop:900 length:834 start_codon:yes stop_codon:yes gene_type:complete